MNTPTTLDGLIKDCERLASTPFPESDKFWMGYADLDGWHEGSFDTQEELDQWLTPRKVISKRGKRRILK